MHAVQEMLWAAALTLGPAKKGLRDHSEDCSHGEDNLLLFSKFTPLKCHACSMTFLRISHQSIHRGEKPPQMQDMCGKFYLHLRACMPPEEPHKAGTFSVHHMGKVSGWKYISVFISEAIQKMPRKYGKFSWMLVLFNICTANRHSDPWCTCEALS